MYRFAICVLAATAAAAAESTPLPPTTPASAQALLGSYCQGCHNDKTKTAGFSLDGVQTTDIAAHAQKLEKVLRKVRTGEMPPPGLPRPKAAANASLVNWLESALDRNIAVKPNPGAPSVHRLNRAEYANAVRDLLALDLDHSASLPADDSGYGFDNIGEVLTVSPLLMEKYMATARRVSRLAVGTAKFSASLEKFTPGRVTTSGQLSDTGEELPLSTRSGMAVRYYFPADAEYAILARVRGNPDPTLPVARLDLRIDGVRAKVFDAEFSAAEEAQNTRNFEIRVPLKAGMHVIGASFLNEYTKSETTAGLPRGPFPTRPPSNVTLEYMTIGGPFNPKGPGDTASRRHIFSCRPAAGQPETACAQRIISTLARHAYRRPVGPADTAPLLKLFAAGRAQGKGFDAGIEMALRAILVSPSFLFRIEADPAASAPGSVRKINELELASRLSFFLWSSIPDEELLRLASQNALRKSLPAQVKRMLADPKSKALIDNFAGQWLHLRNIANWRPDPDKYPQFDDSLRAAMQRETEMFFAYIVRDDRQVLDFINADYSFLNERLARHYNVKGVKGNYYRRVSLPGNERGGILSQGSILTVTSYPTRTSPVLRGKWILENVLGAPPPPPPPDIPDLDDKAAISAKDLRAALEKHRANPACASCHSRLDPLGFALENYDAIGKFRLEEGGAVIDASGQLPSGAKLAGPGDLKSILTERRDEFVDCLSEKLLTYALGRGLEHYDMPAVRQVRRETARLDYRFSAMVNAIVNSVPFQMKRTPEK